MDVEEFIRKIIIGFYFDSRAEQEELEKILNAKKPETVAMNTRSRRRNATTTQP